MIEDWQGLVAAAKHHGILPFLGRHLGGDLGEAVPGAAMRWMRPLFGENVRASYFMLQETARLLRFFKEKGITALPFKGPLLAEEAFGDAALRAQGDLDFIMGRKDAFLARDLLLREGFRSDLTLTPRQERAYGDHYYALTLANEETGVVVDLHWELSRRFFPRTLEASGCMGRARELALGGDCFRVLSTEDHLLLLCLHGAKHRWERLLWIVDVAELVRSGAGLDWKMLGGEAERLHARRALYSGLGLARDLLGAGIPEEAGRIVDGDRGIKSLVREAMDGLMRGEGSSSRVGALRKASFQIRSLDKVRERIRFCLLWLLLPNLNDWMWVRLPDRAFGLYWAVRPVRLLLQYGRSILPGTPPPAS